MPFWLMSLNNQWSFISGFRGRRSNMNFGSKYNWFWNWHKQILKTMPLTKLHQICWGRLTYHRQNSTHLRLQLSVLRILLWEMAPKADLQAGKAQSGRVFEQKLSPSMSIMWNFNWEKWRMSSYEVRELPIWILLELRRGVQRGDALGLSEEGKLSSQYGLREQNHLNLKNFKMNM